MRHNEHLANLVATLLDKARDGAALDLSRVLDAMGDDVRLLDLFNSGLVLNLSTAKKRALIAAIELLTGKKYTDNVGRSKSRRKAAPPSGRSV